MHPTPKVGKFSQNSGGKTFKSPNHQAPNVRAICAQLVFGVLEEGKSLSALLGTQNNLSPQDLALLQELSFGIMRYLPRLEKILALLLQKPLNGKKRLAHCLLLVGLYQILYTRIPPFASVNEVVNACQALKLTPLRSLINGVLRTFLRQQEEILAQADQHWHSLHPDWLINLLKPHYSQWREIIDANNQRPPMWIRVNPQISVAEYAQQLQNQGLECEFKNSPPAIRLQSPCSVSQLPNFHKGASTVQDLHAQWAGILLEPKNGERILDACSAPGGKVTHILELAPEAEVMALDIDEKRLQRVRENLARCGQRAEVRCGDASQPQTWLGDYFTPPNSGEIFHKILLDAPCSATGVIRRHPDIKWLRQASDIPKLVQLQQEILESLWKLLKPQGILLYATCSILPMENSQQIQSFLNRHPEAELVELPFLNSSTSQVGEVGEIGKQFFPTINGGDGFYYAKLKKVK